MPTLQENLLFQMTLVRRFEERVLALFSKGKLFGTTHCYIGQEAVAAGVMNHLLPEDIVVSNHRCHGHYLLRTMDLKGLMAELMGRRDGVSGGRGGSQHLCDGRFFSNGIQGNMMPVAAGMAFAEKRRRPGAVVAAFIGDGTLGQGTVYETFNMIGLWELPLLVVVEDNLYAQTTHRSTTLSGDLLARAAAFGLSCGEIESNDAEALYHRFEKIIAAMRESGKAHVEILHTYRICAHSKGDDFRDSAEIDAWKEKDPLEIMAKRVGDEEKQRIETETKRLIREAEQQAEASPFPRWKGA